MSTLAEHAALVWFAIGIVFLVSACPIFPCRVTDLAWPAMVYWVLASIVIGAAAFVWSVW